MNSLVSHSDTVSSSSSLAMSAFALWITFAAGAGPLPGQDERELILQAVEKQERLELCWRRDAQGNFEYAVAAEKDPQWQPWFSEGFARALGVIGASGPLALLGHSGDVLSLTDGERHLHRLGVSLSTGDLAAFVRMPLPEAARDVALLDRMVAIDVLRARSDADAQVLVTELGADATLPKGLRERASATVARLALDPVKWPLPAAADAFVVVRQAKMPSARPLLELGRFSCLVASAEVLTRLKQPTQQDFVSTKTESEVCAEIPFEIARHLGNYRLDETGFTIRLHQDGTSPEWTMCGVGHFDTRAIGATAPELGITFDALSDTTITARSQGLAVASRPDFGKQLLANRDAAVLVHVPKGSSLVAYGDAFGVPGIVHADLAVTLREADVLFDLRLGAADAAAAKTLADAIKKKLGELGWPSFLRNFAIEVDESLLRVEPDADFVRVTFNLRRAAFPSLERAKQQVLEQTLRPAVFSLAPPVHAEAPAGPSVEWIRSHAIPFSTAEAGNGFDDLAGLDNVIGDARIVALGEPTHGTREAFQMKHRLLEYLVERHGFSIFSLEASMPEADALDAYVNGGEGDPRQLLSGYGWTGDTEEFLAMVEWMRAWNAAHPERPRLRYTAFDMQTPTVAARKAAQFVRKHAPHMEPSAVLLDDLPARGEVSQFTSATGEFPVEVARGKELVVNVWIRTEITDGWAGLWWRCDTPRGPGAFDNMQSRGIIGTTDWTRYETRLTIDDDVQNINFGCVLAGEGTAWFDDIEITLDGKPFVNPTFGFGFEEGTGSFVLPQRAPRGAGCVVHTVDTRPHGGKRCLEIQRKPEPDTGLVKDAERVVADMLAHRDEFARKTSAREADWAIQNARVVAQWARMTFAEYPSGVQSGVRDECMAENVAWLLEQNPGARAVLWAHNFHVSREEFRGITPMGGHLERRFPDQMVVFGFSTGRGTYTAFAPRGWDVRSDNPLHPPPEDSIESYLASARLPRFLLDIRAARDAPSASWAIVEHPMRHIGARAVDEQFFPCVVRDAFDVLVWQEETTASVPIRR